MTPLRLVEPLSLCIVLVVLLGSTTARAGDYAANWGPTIGQPLPLLAAPDHTGKARTFENLKGPRGLLLFMNRSTDW